jgi:ABC-type Mn2+/Zn2+ transport system permease subunit
VSEGFVASWALFGTTYAVGLLAAVALAQAGVWVVARDQIFLGATVAQASALGVAVALFGAPLLELPVEGLEGEATPALLAIFASVATAWLAGQPPERTVTTAEARTGWIFLAATALPVLLLSHRPHGLEEIERLMFSTLLAASRHDLVIFALVAAIGAALTARLGPALLLYSVDPASAAAAGLRPARWRLLSAVWLGVAVGLSIRAAGTLFTFGCLVLPALVASGVTREVRTLVWVAPGVALTAALCGFWLAHTADWPPAHATVALLCALLPLAWLARRLRNAA